MEKLGISTTDNSLTGIALGSETTEEVAAEGGDEPAREVSTFGIVKSISGNPFVEA